MGNLKHDIFAKIRQTLSSSHQKHPYSTSLTIKVQQSTKHDQ